MWQAEFVRDALSALYPHVTIKLIGVTTEADRRQDSSLESLGGKGVFVKELEQALLEGRADLAVHSMKDVSIKLPADLCVPVVLERADARDVFISNRYSRFDDLPRDARVGTSSLRRRCQLMEMCPDLQVLDIRGNVGTRLRKLDEGRFDAIILAAAGVQRLGLGERISEYFPLGRLLPAVSQGAMGLEIHRENTAIAELIEPLVHTESQCCVAAERAFNGRLGGDCHVPVAAHARIEGKELKMDALVGTLDGSEVLRSSLAGAMAEAEEIGTGLGQALLDLGAGPILAQLPR